MDFIIVNYPDCKEWNQITWVLGSNHALGACLSMAFSSSTLPVLYGSVHRRIQARIGYNKKTPKISLTWKKRRHSMPTLSLMVTLDYCHCLPHCDLSWKIGNDHNWGNSGHWWASYLIISNQGHCSKLSNQNYSPSIPTTKQRCGTLPQESPSQWLRERMGQALVFLKQNTESYRHRSEDKCGLIWSLLMISWIEK